MSSATGVAGATVTKPVSAGPWARAWRASWPAAGFSPDSGGADPAPVENRLLSIVENSISALLYAQTRGDLFQLYALTLATGMNYRLTAVPMGEDAPADATSFDPVQMKALFEVGRKYAREGKAWRAIPPQSGRW